MRARLRLLWARLCWRAGCFMTMQRLGASEDPLPAGVRSAPCRWAQRACLANPNHYRPLLDVLLAFTAAGHAMDLDVLGRLAVVASVVLETEGLGEGRVGGLAVAT